MAVFAIDVDGVVAHLEEAWLARYNRDYNDTMTVDQWTSWSIGEIVKPECGVKIYDYLEDPTLYDDVRPVEGALEAVEILRKHGHQVIFVTTSPIKTAGRKFRWLVDHGFLPDSLEGLDDYYEARNKSRIAADILVDDAQHNIESFPGKAILFERPWNQSFEWQPSVTGWDDFLDLYFNSTLGMHPTELLRPIQAQAFKEILDRMYVTHLQKNADYSPANILATGEVGLVTRLWDKVARLLNLTGFQIEISESRFTAPKQPKNEAIEDTYMDLAVYGIIGLLLRQGKWGK